MPSSATAIPARYAKFITALLGAAVGYLTAYGPVQGALVMAGTALAVLGVPNAEKPEEAVVAAQPGNVKVIPADPANPADPGPIEIGPIR